MKEILESISFGESLVLTAPPGWGKTYKLLDAISKVKRKVAFIFPLRALCDEVYISAHKKGIKVLNYSGEKEQASYADLVVCTPELCSFEILKDRIIILDEFHLFYYWGDTFRHSLREFFFEVCSNSNPLILLTATLSNEFKERLKRELSFNYHNNYLWDVGNQKLKNYPSKIFYYPKKRISLMWRDIFHSDHSGCVLVFCAYRQEVQDLTRKLEARGRRVLSCVGGRAKEFCLELVNLKRTPEFIVATSVVSHGVNLPDISKIYFTYKVDNIDFYLQMIGRGGRDGGHFEVHTQELSYFSKFALLSGFFRTWLKSLRNNLNYLLYCLYES